MMTGNHEFVANEAIKKPLACRSEYAILSSIEGHSVIVWK